jgi:NHL repeat
VDADRGYVRAFADYGSGPGQLSSPGQVAVDGAGFVYVADSANHRVEKFTPDGRFAASIGQGAGLFVGPDQLSTPKGVTVAPDGTIYASDELYRRVQHYTADGAFLGSFGSQGSGDGQFEAPGGVAAGADGVYVADRSLSSIQRFSAAGAFLDRVGSGPGSGPGQFSHPSYLALDCRSTLYVADRDNNRTQRLGAAGAAPCGDPAHDPAERLKLTSTAKTPQRFRGVFAIAVSVACDRPCTATVSGTVKIAGRRRALRIHAQTRKLDGMTAMKVNVAPGERDTDRVLAALRRHRKVVATVHTAAIDVRRQRTATTRRVRLR